MKSEFVTIGIQWHLVAFGLECLLESDLRGAEVQKVFLDSNSDQVSAKSYVFYDSRGTIVRGEVDEYEPEELRLIVTGNKRVEKKLADLVERAGYQAGRIEDGEVGT